MRCNLVVIFVLMLIPIPIAFAVPYVDPEEIFNYSETVIVGKVLSTEILSEPQITRSENSATERSGIALYQIQIERYLKNPSDAKNITVSGLFLRELHGFSYETYPYEVGQRVLLYLQKNDYGWGDTDFTIITSTSRILNEDSELVAYEQLNYRIVNDSEFEKLLNTEVVGYGIDEKNNGIFITVDPKYVTQENFEKYEKIFRGTIGNDIPIRFEVGKRAEIHDASDFDFRILALIVVPASVCVVIYYFWRTKK